MRQKGMRAKSCRIFRQDGADSRRGFGFARCRKLCWSVDSRYNPLTVFLNPENLFLPFFRCLTLADGALLQIGTKKGRFQRAYLQKCTMAELSGQASGPRSPHTRYPRVIDSERGLYRQAFCRDIAIDNAGHVVFASWSHFFGMIEEMPIYSNGTKTGTLQPARLTSHT